MRVVLRCVAVCNTCAARAAALVRQEPLGPVGDRSAGAVPARRTAEPPASQPDRGCGRCGSFLGEQTLVACRPLPAPREVAEGAARSRRRSGADSAGVGRRANAMTTLILPTMVKRHGRAPSAPPERTLKTAAQHPRAAGRGRTADRRSVRPRPDRATAMSSMSRATACKRCDDCASTTAEPGRARHEPAGAVGRRRGA